MRPNYWNLQLQLGHWYLVNLPLFFLSRLYVATMKHPNSLWGFYSFFPPDSDIFVLDWKNFWSLRMCLTLLVYNYTQIWSGHYWFLNLARQLNFLTDQRLLTVYLIRVTCFIFVLGWKIIYHQPTSVETCSWGKQQTNQTSKNTHTHTHNFPILSCISQTCSLRKMQNVLISLLHWIYICIS